MKAAEHTAAIASVGVAAPHRLLTSRASPAAASGAPAGAEGCAVLAARSAAACPAAHPARQQAIGLRGDASHRPAEGVEREASLADGVPHPHRTITSGRSKPGIWGKAALVYLSGVGLEHSGAGAFAPVPYKELCCLLSTPTQRSVFRPFDTFDWRM